ncbi:MAG: alpha/beta fold hydrolase [Candidatus Micrarchaeota archaeon]
MEKTIEKQKLFFNSRGLKLCGILEAPNPKNKTLLVMIHGYASGKEGETYVKTADITAAHGRNSFRFDLAGNFESEGKFEEQTITTMIADTLAAIAFLKTKGFTKFELLGSSAGGLVALIVASQMKIEKIALIAPVSNYVEQRTKKYGEAKIKEWKEKGYNYYDAGKRGKFKVNYSAFEDMHNYLDTYTRVEKIKCPVLILHGDKDEDVSLSDSEELVKHLQKGKLIVLKGADHKLFVNGNRNEAIRIISEWLVS